MSAAKCYGFQWIGQSMRYCDGCGKPFWEHTHDETYRNGRRLRKVITTERRDAVRAKWDGDPS